MGTVLPFQKKEGSQSTEAPDFERSYVETRQEDEKATPEGLYKVKDVDRVTKLVSIVDTLNLALENICVAIADFEDEVEREIQLDLLRNNIFELILLKKDVSQNFGDLLTAFHVCLKNKTNTPFSKIELVKLRNVIGLIKNNFNMSDHVFNECLYILDENFDLTIPMRIEPENG
ncbi:MAG: hypothetical protein RDU59_09410 [Thermodesulfobacteriota bacterium]|nr:hypothetical protein [Thermodesulfobacteriota bacterium]